MRDVDFTVESAPQRDPNKSYGGNRRQRVMLSPDCFKRLCMRTASARGEMVRSYFLALEELLVKYTNQLIVGIQADVDRLEKAQQAPAIKDFAGYIYVIRASSHKDGFYKIGRTDNLVKRLRTYRTGRLEDVEVLFKYRTDNLKSVENCIKQAMADHRYHKSREIFQADIDFIKGIATRCVGLSTWKQEYARRKASKMTGGTYIVVDRGDQ